MGSRSWIRNFRSCWKLFPDKEGIETLPGQWFCRLRGHRWKLFPDEEGIETKLVACGFFNRGRNRWKLFPDEEGIETALRLRRETAQGWKDFPDEEGI